MIGDLIGKPGAAGRGAAAPGAARGARHRLRDRQRREPGWWHGPHGIHRADGPVDAGVDVITSGNHIWDKREIIPELDREPAHPAPAELRRRTGVPGPRLGHLPRPRRHRGRGHQRPGPDLHAADREPVHDRRHAARGGRRRAAGGPPGRLPLRADQREDRLRASTSTAASAPSSGPTRTCRPPTSGSCRAARPTSATWA